MAFTVTATESGASASHGVALLVRVLTNATEAGGATSGSTGGGVTSQGSLTPNFSSSYVAFSVSGDNVTAMPAAATSNTYDFTNGNPSSVWATAQGHYTGTVTAATPLTYGAGSAGAQDHANWCAYEIPASGGTITLDGSSPAGVLSAAGLASGTAATTASFTPPVGAVLVAEVCAGGTGTGAGITMSITDTAGLGMVWTRRAVSSTTDNFQPTWVYTTTVPATFTGISTTGLPAIPGQTWKRYFRHPQHQPEVAAVPPPPAYPPQQYAQPGLAWKQNFHLPQRPKQVPGVLPPYIAGLAGGTSGYFVDQNSKPRLYFATVPWGMPANAGRWNGGDWASDFDQYFADIKAQGMTAAEMHPWGHSHTGCNNDLGNTWDGVSPWTTLPALNNTFWLRIDSLLNSALVHGITVFLVLNMQCDMGVDAFAGTGVFNGVSAANVQAACQNIAARYASQPNLIFFQGDDYNNDDDTRMQAVVDGLHAGGYTGPTGTEEYSSGTTSRRDLSGSPTGTPFTFGGANSTFNWCYYYNVTYFAVEQAYKENNQIPVVWGDGFYVGGGTAEPADSHLMRNFVWWALASGARGVSMGSEAIHPWPSGVFTNPVDGITTNAWYNNSAKAVYTAFTGLTGWQNLLPDLTSTLVTAGRGTRAVYSSQTFLSANLGTDNYVAASITPDHSLAVIYCAVAMSVTIDQTQLDPGYTATWIDPASGATQSAATGATYASAGLGNNSAGNADWVLVLQGAAVTARAPGRALLIQAVTAGPAGQATFT